jgi:sugar phosphate isomerase/epimerase
METHWSAHLTLSIVHFMIYPETMKGEGPILETVRKIAEDEFFSGIEITQIKDAATRKEVKALLAAAGMPVAYGAQPVLLTQKLDLNAEDHEMRARAVAAIKGCIEEASELGMSRLALLSGKDPGTTGRAAALDRLADSLAQICEYGRGFGIGITLETFDNAIEKKAVVGPSDLAAAFSARMRLAYPDFGLMYDLSHQPLLDEQALPALTLLKSHLVHAHVGNCVKERERAGYGDQHPRFGFPGGENGVAELADFLQALFAIGYLKKTPDGSKPWVGIEVKPMPGETSEAVLADTKRAWIEAWARVAAA